jgi:hypothetical protein
MRFEGHDPLAYMLSWSGANRLKLSYNYMNHLL